MSGLPFFVKICNENRFDTSNHKRTKKEVTDTWIWKTVLKNIPGLFYGSLFLCNDVCERF